MIIVDHALEQRAEQENPIQVGMVGAGFMGAGIANQMLKTTPGMRLAAIANRTLDRAVQVYKDAGADEVAVVEDGRGIDAAVDRGQWAVSGDASALCQSERLDAIIEVTGTVEHAARVVVDAVGHGKHVVLMNAELDGTIGPALKRRADKAGVVYTACDGDQPGVQMNLYRFVKALGLEPLVCGNIKGLHDPYRNPTTQEGFAKKWGQNVYMVTSFADGTKISFEQAIVANATSMTIACRGMRGETHEGHVDELTGRFDVDELRGLGGIVEYVVGARPSPGVFVLAAHEDAKHQHYLNLYKLGEGPLYSFYTPYHLCHFEVPTSVARAVLFEDAVLAPEDKLRVEVVTTAKRDISAGEIVDRLGGYMTYGQCERADVAEAERLLPIGLAEGCIATRNIARDEVITCDDVDFPRGRVVDLLRAEQDTMFGSEQNSVR